MSLRATISSCFHSWGRKDLPAPVAPQADQPATPDPQGLQAHQDRQGLAQLAQQGPPVQQVRQELLARQASEPQALQEQRDREEKLADLQARRAWSEETERRGHPGRLVLPGASGRLDRRGVWEVRAGKAIRVPTAPRARPVSEQRDQPGCKETPELWAQRAQQVMARLALAEAAGPQGHLERQEMLAKLVELVLPALQVPSDPVVLRGMQQLAQLETSDLLDLLAGLGLQGRREYLASSDQQVLVVRSGLQALQVLLEA